MLSISDSVQFLAARAGGDPSESPESSISHVDDFSIHPGNLEETLSSRAFAAFEVPTLHSERDSAARTTAVFDHSGSLGLLEDPGSANNTNYIDLYFDSVHIKNPILVEDEFRRCYRAVCTNGIGWDAESCLVLLVLANGAVSTNAFNAPVLDDSRHLRAAEVFFSAAHKRIGTLMMGSPLLQARCWFLCGVYFMSMLRPFEAWRAFLQALAACKALPSVVRSRRYSSDSHVNTAAEESIYWSCWKSEQELRYELGIPCTSPSFRNEIDAPLLYPRLPQGLSDHEVQTWYFYLGEISLWRQEMSTRAKIQESLHCRDQSKRHLTRLCLQAFESLTSWEESLPTSLKLGEPLDTDVLKFVLRGRRSYIYELITWPFLYASFESLAVPDEAWELVKLGLRTHYERLTYNSPGFLYRHHGTWLMQRSSARSACLLLFAAHTVNLAATLPVGWREAVQATVDMLDRWRPDFESGGVLTGFMRNMLATAPLTDLHDENASAAFEQS